MSKPHNRIQLLFWLQDMKSLKRHKDGLTAAQRHRLWLKTTNIELSNK
jgi:hypothetical protein